ncbi:MAG: hypothetical protein HFK10_05150 [Clostridia bacterium]|nr:hypothetical protein [Clostridia bacterium]
MNKSRFAGVADAVLLHAVFFVAAFLLLRCLLPSIQSYWAAAAATVAFFALYMLIKRRKKQAFDANRAQNCFLHFGIFPDAARDYFARVLGASSSGRYLAKGDTLYVPLFLPTPVPFEPAAAAYRYAADNGFDKIAYLTALGLDTGAQALTALDGPQIEVLANEKTFSLMTEELEVRFRRKSTKQHFALLRHALERKNARRYLLAALTLFAFAYFMPYSVYYLAFACFSAALGVVCFFHPTDRKKPSSRQDSKRA